MTRTRLIRSSSETWFNRSSTIAAFAVFVIARRLSNLRDAFYPGEGADFLGDEELTALGGHVSVRAPTRPQRRLAMI